MKKIVAPLALLASLTLLSSCTSNRDVPIPIVPASEKVAPVPVEVITSPPPVPQTTTSGEILPKQSSAISPSGATTHQKVVSYMSPGGQDLIEFSVTIEDGIILSAQSVGKAGNKISENWQKSFSENLSQKVVGKKVKTLALDAVGGASLTTEAFEKYVKELN